MRSLLLAAVVTGCLGMVPEPGRADHASRILSDFPELAEWGHPVWIGGYEFWRPYDNLAYDWTPYENGYFYDDAADGLVWVSNDPWGFITEHYGYWRHHDRYGFVWRPLDPIVWRPYVASIFRDDYGSIMAWCPFYYDVWASNYYVVGFGWDDYYWGSFWGGVHYGGFYRHHYNRFHGYWVGVTLYQYDVHYVSVPNHCYRRDRDYRERRQRNDAKSPYVVQRELPAQPVPSLATRSRAGAEPAAKRAAGPDLPRRRSLAVEQERKERTERRLERASVWAPPGASRPAQQRSAVRPDVAPSWNAVRREAAQPAPAEPARRAVESRRAPLQVVRPSAVEARPSPPERGSPARQPAAVRVAPSQPAAVRAAPSRPAARVEPQRSAAPERLRQAVEAQRKSKNGR